jgi:hypothetical protein
LRRERSTEGFGWYPYLFQSANKKIVKTSLPVMIEATLAINQEFYDFLGGYLCLLSRF